jgi:hypothetical protein
MLGRPSCGICEPRKRNNMKTCSKCGIEKDEGEFYNSAKKGLQAWCKICQNKEAKQYNEKNKEKVRTRQHEWKQKNKNKINALKKTEKYRKKDRERFYKNKEYIYAQHKKHRVKNIEKYRKNNRIRMAVRSIAPNALELITPDLIDIKLKIIEAKRLLKPSK